MQNTEALLGGSEMSRLRDAFTGDTITPGDEAYDEARSVYFRAIDRRPAAIVYPVSVGDVKRVVDFARDSGSPLAIRSGGHSPAGHGVCDGGIVLDVSRLRSIEIDANARRARVGAGVTTGEYTTTAGAHGLATNFGDAPTVGVSGITLAGGIGFLHRKHGLSVDHLLGAEIVTADGQVLRADASSHPELFWAIRGGGGNFGVVTQLEFRLEPVETVLGGMLILPATPERVVDCLQLADGAAEELSMIVMLAQAPAMPFIPAEHHGRPILLLNLVYCADPASGEAVVAPFRKLASPIVDGVRPMRYPEVYEAEAGPPPEAVAFDPCFIDALGLTEAEALMEHLATGRAPMRAAQFRPLGGAAARVPAGATAFAHRSRRFMAGVAAMYQNPADAAEHTAWVAAGTSCLGEGRQGAYVGFVGADGASRVHDVYPPDTFERLTRVKARYDPSNLFRHNHNVEPATAR